LTNAFAPRNRLATSRRVAARRSVGTSRTGSHSIRVQWNLRALLGLPGRFFQWPDGLPGSHRICAYAASEYYPRISGLRGV